MKEDSIVAIVDDALERLVEWKGNMLPGSPPESMFGGPAEDDWNYWLPVPSTISDHDLNEIEAVHGVALSSQYRALLKHRHFLELPIGEVHIIPSPCDSWRRELLQHVTEHYGFLLERRVWCFAEFSDWGQWCFSLSELSPDGEPAVYQWDHENPADLKYIAVDLATALQHAID